MSNNMYLLTEILLVFVKTSCGTFFLLKHDSFLISFTLYVLCSMDMIGGILSFIYSALPVESWKELYDKDPKFKKSIDRLGQKYSNPLRLMIDVFCDAVLVMGACSFHHEIAGFLIAISILMQYYWANMLLPISVSFREKIKN